MRFKVGDLLKKREVLVSDLDETPPIKYIFITAIDSLSYHYYYLERPQIGLSLPIGVLDHLVIGTVKR